MFSWKLVFIPALILLAAFEARTAVILKTESVAAPIVPAASAVNFPIFVPDFNTNLGTLDSVHITVSLSAEFAGTYFFTGGPFDPFSGFSPMPLQYEFSTLPIFLYAGGFPVNVLALSAASSIVVGDGPGIYSSEAITPPAMSDGTVPPPFFSAFESKTVPAMLTLEQTGTLLTPLTPYISDITGEGTLEGYVQVAYDYTPFVTSTGPSAAPEPQAFGLLAIGLIAVCMMRRR